MYSSARKEVPLAISLQDSFVSQVIRINWPEEVTKEDNAKSKK